MTLNNETIREILKDSDVTLTVSDGAQNVTGNATVTSSKMASSHDIHLWLPYVLLTLVLIAMAVASFVKYHYKNKKKYEEKLETAKMKMNKPFRKYRVKLGGRGLGESESKCAGLPMANGVSICRSDSKGSSYRKWMDLDVKRFAQNHTNNLMVKQSPAHLQALAYAYNNPVFETSGTSDCDVINSDYEITGFNAVADAADVDVSEQFDSSDDNAPTRIDDFLRNLGMNTRYDRSGNEDAISMAVRHKKAYPYDSSTGYSTSTMVASGDSFNLDTDTGTECGTVSTNNRSNRDSFVSFDSDQTYDARSQEARMAGYNSLGSLDDGVARVFVNEYDTYHTDTDHVDTDIERRRGTDPDTDQDSDTLNNTKYNSDNSVQARDTEAETESMSLPRSTTSPESAAPFDGIGKYLTEGASYELPPGVRNRNQSPETEHVTAL